MYVLDTYTVLSSRVGTIGGSSGAGNVKLTALGVQCNLIQGHLGTKVSFLTQEGQEALQGMRLKGARKVFPFHNLE
jgi:hypothetical protein